MSRKRVIEIALRTDIRFNAVEVGGDLKKGVATDAFLPFIRRAISF